MKKTLLTFLGAACIPWAAWADVQLPAIISDHMVLQRSERSAIWGKADPGESVKVGLAGKTLTATADERGCWKTAWDTRECGPGPWELVVEGRNRLVISDALIGEVWLASGQSNMDFSLEATLGAKEEMANAHDPLLRMFRVTSRPQPEPADDCTGSWVVAAPGTAGTFSAVAYYFAKDLRQALNVPVGMIHSAWSGTPIEAWISREALDSNPDLKAGRLRDWKRLADAGRLKEKYASDYALWLKQNEREDKVSDPAAYAGPIGDLGGWSRVTLPAPGAAPGAVWLRREIDLPASAAGRPLKINWPESDGFRTVYWNGEKVSESTFARPDSLSASASIPGNVIKAGRNVVAIRIFSPAAPAAISGEARKFVVRTLTGSQEWPLAGDWLTKQEYLLAPPRNPPPSLPPPALAQATASYLFNSRIHPLLPYGIRGVIWYQGESNAGRAAQYRETFPLMITDWRTRWAQGDMPFYFCQLANYREPPSAPAESDWAELRESQEAALAHPNVQRAVLIDIGEIGDIHPRNKKEAAARLARIALARDYGKSLAYGAPVMKSHAREGGKIRIVFAHAEGGLVAGPVPPAAVYKSLTAETRPLQRNMPGSQLEGFALCGPDKTWVWAEAKIEGDSVVVWSPKVSEPVAVRYAWADNPICNLFNAAGLPASPFRTDDFPLTTAKRKF